MKKFFIMLIMVSVSFLSAQVVPIDSIQGYATSSPYINRTVTTIGVVTATPQDWVRSLQGFFIQDAESPWHAIFVYTGSLSITLDRGDSVQVTGRVSEYYNRTEINLSSQSDLVILKKGARIPKALKVTCSEAGSEPYEGVLIRVDSVTVTNNNLGYGEWEIQDPQGGIVRVDDAAGYSYSPNLNDFIYSIIGVVDYSYDVFKIEPRRNQDIIFDGDGTGYFYFENGIIASGDQADLFLNVEPSSPFRLQSIKVVIPSNFSFSGNVLLSGEGFQNAVARTILDTILIENAEIETGKNGTLQITGVHAPNTPGEYPFNVLTLSQSSFKLNPDPPMINVVSIIGGGSATITPTIVPENTSIQVEIQLTNTFGTIRQVKAILPRDYYEWTRSITLRGAGFRDATWSVSQDTITILGCAIDSTRTGSIVLNNINFIQEGLTQIQILTGTADSVGTIASPPSFFIAMPDTTIKLRYFHNPITNTFLSGRTVMIKGTVSGVIGDRTYVQDSTGGIIVYRGPSLSPNTLVKLQGQYSEYRNSSQLYSATLLASFGASLVEAESLSFPPQEIHEGTLVKTFELTPPAGTTYFVPDSALVFKDSLNREYRIYVASTTDLAYKPIPRGKIDIRGCVYQFDAYYNIQPRSTRDIIAKGDGAGIFTLEPPYIYYDSTSNISLLISSPYSPIRSIELTATGAIVDTFSFEGAGFTHPFVDSFYRDSSGFHLCISGGIELVEDTIVLIGLQPQNNVEAITFLIKTSVDSGGFRSPVLTNPTLYVAYPIKHARRNGPDGYTPEFLNQRFSVIGVVTAPPRIFSTTRTSMYIQDETGGINVYYSGSYVDFNEGDLVRVKGTILQYNGLTEIAPSSTADLVLLGQGYAVDPTLVPQGTSVGEALEGLLVTIEGTCGNEPYMSGSGRAFTLYNGLIPIDIYVYNTTGVDISNVLRGNVYRITGVVGQYDATAPYNSGYQILPRFQEDVIQVQPAQAAEVNLTISPNVFSPYLGEALRLEVSGPSNAIYNLKIFNGSGKLVKTIAMGRTVPFAAEWRGTDEKESMLPSGLYIILLEYTTPAGKSERIQKPVIISKPK
ncbi:MAG TPA: hypothetical protein PKU94_06855 [Candidatus Hydrothermia bacterium]|nr:hypothetical protein [Candidatus Hydrothermia bacterium]